MPSKKTAEKICAAANGQIELQDFFNKNNLKRCETCGSVIRKDGKHLGAKLAFLKADGKAFLLNTSSGKEALDV